MNRHTRGITYRTAFVVLSHGVAIIALSAGCIAAPDEAQRSVGSASSSTWPVFRGNRSGTGVATGSLTESPQLLWKLKSDGTFFQATAAIAGNVVFVGDADRNFYAVDLDTGEQKWKFTTEIGFTAAAAVRDDRVYVGDSDGIFYCLAAADGRLIWKHETGAEINSSANFFKDSVLFGSQDGSLYRLRCADGKVVWKYTIEASGGIQCSPTLAEDRAFVCGCDGQLHVIDVEKGISTATLQIGDPSLCTPAIAGDLAYFGTEGGSLFAVDWRVPKVAWRYEHPQRKLSYRSSAAVTAKAVIVGGRNKVVDALDPATGAVLWSFATRGRVDSSPVIVGNRAYVGSADGRLYGLDLQTGKSTWEYDAGTGFSASPAVASSRLVIGNEDGVLFCFGRKELEE